jgi:hypothetical protein
MTPVTITPEAKRQLTDIAERNAPMIEADAAFFLRKPKRQYRVRLASAAEIEERRVLDPHLWPLPHGWRAFIAVRCIAPGLRMRALAVAPEGSETDLSEKKARSIWVMATGGRVPS